MRQLRNAWSSHSSERPCTARGCAAVIQRDYNKVGRSCEDVLHQGKKVKMRRAGCENGPGLMVVTSSLMLATITILLSNIAH